MKIQIDCYGFEATSENFQKRKLEAFLIKNDAGIVYACFGTGERWAIHRIDKDPDGCVRVMWAYGKWEEAEASMGSDPMDALRGFRGAWQPPKKISASLRS